MQPALGTRTAAPGHAVNMLTDEQPYQVDHLVQQSCRALPSGFAGRSRASFRPTWNSRRGQLARRSRRAGGSTELNYAEKKY